MTNEQAESVLVFLQAMLAEQRKTNEILAALAAALKGGGAASSLLAKLTGRG